MSLENEDGSSAIQASEAIDDPQKKPKFSYARDFLLSLSELEICKRLPSDFDQSILSEFQDTSRGIQERPRTHGSLPLQGFRRNDYSSSPPTRGAGVYGRWDNRSSGWNDKDGDSQSELDSDSGRRIHGSQNRRSWQNSEHDGLLGSGSFPRPSGFAAGSSASKGQTNEHYHLNRSSEAYHPPRPFKAVPHSRTSPNDSFNDETFGSDECTSQDRAEEERKRRASFELMRKEQQKVLQEKQKLNANKNKSDCFTDMILEEAKEEGLSETNSELDSATHTVSNNDSRKPSSLLPSSKPRPLVPPGFTSTVLEKTSALKPLTSSTDKENPRPGTEELHLLAKGSHAQNGTLDNQGTMQPVQKLDIKEQQPEDKNGSGPKMGEVIIPDLPEVLETVDGAEGFELMTKKFMGNKFIGNPSQGRTTSILEKLFGGATTNENGGSSGLVELQVSRPDDSTSPRDDQSSKFAQWFNEDEKKPVNDVPSGRPNDLLSLIVGGEKAGTEQILPELSYKSVDPTKVITSGVPLDSKHVYDNYKQESAPPVATVLTCEDLEQTILSEYSEKSSLSQTTIPDWSTTSQENTDAKAVDNHATHHLLSLLQKGTSTEDIKSSSANVGPSEKHPAPKPGSVTMFDKLKDAKTEDTRNSGQSLTLETLFGTAFMKELQSAQAPVSVQRGSAGSARNDVLEPRDDGLFPSTVDGTGSNMTNYDNSLLGSKQKQPPRSDDLESWSQFDGPHVNMSLGFQKEVPKLSKQAVDGTEIQLPEEESLITVGDPSNPHNAMLFAARNPTMGRPLPPESSFDIAEKLAALNSGFRGERAMAAPEGARFVRGPYDLLEPERQFSNLHNQASPPQMNHGRRAMFHPLDPHNPQMRFPEHLMQRDTPPGHQFPSNMLRPPFHHPDTRVTGFDVPTHHQLLPQMQMAGNFPPPHLLRDFARPSPVHPHPSNQAANFMPEREAMHGFPFGHGQNNIGGLGMPLPDGSSGSNHPEALQRMMEMELRAQSKQIRPGHELDMGFRYR